MNAENHTGRWLSARRAVFLLGLALLTTMLLSAAAWAQSGKRLILKDSSWQGISEYEIKGDRVRYLSSERGEWEELPQDLVDWKATEAWNAGPRVRSQEERDQAIAEEENERRAMEAQTPLVVPGLRLPYEGGVFLLDLYQGQPELAEIAQNGAEINPEKASHRILRSAINPVAVQKQTLDLKGAHARVQSHVALPELYVAVPPDFSYGPPIAERFRIVRLSSKKDLRTVQSIKMSVTGKVSQQSTLVLTRVEKFSGEWLKVVPTDGLQPGEYALVEVLNQNEMNFYVWDFGVNANAAANPGLVQPEPGKPKYTGADPQPVLQPGRK